MRTGTKADVLGAVPSYGRPMADDVEFTGSVPELYDRLMVPMIFTEPAISLARRVASRAAVQIVETAAGTGVLTEALLAASRAPRCWRPTSTSRCSTAPR